MLRKLLKKAGLYRDGVRLRGDIELVIWNKDGTLKDYRLLENIITDLGCAWIADKCADDTKAVMKYMAVGTGTQSVKGAVTALKSELDRNTLNGSKPSQLTGANDHKFQCKATWGTGDGTGGWQEAGVFNAATAGTMLCYMTYSVVNKGSADTITITWIISVADDGA